MHQNAHIGVDPLAVRVTLTHAINLASDKCMALTLYRR